MLTSRSYKVEDEMVPYDLAQESRSSFVWHLIER